MGWAASTEGTTSFNPRPAPRSRATVTGEAVTQLLRVSIHARLRGAGRPTLADQELANLVFQSTPGSEEPGDS